jgi:hypothetical protein
MWRKWIAHETTVFILYAGKTRGIAYLFILPFFCCSQPGLVARLEAELTASRPLGKPIKVTVSTNPVADAWTGAALLATQADMFTKNKGALTLEDYEEKGLDYLMEYSGFVFPSLQASKQ